MTREDRMRRIRVDADAGPEATARRLIAAYEAARPRPRSDEYRAAYDRLAAFVRERGGWIQAVGLRFVWSRGKGALVRQVVGPQLYRTPAPVKV